MVKVVGHDLSQLAELLKAAGFQAVSSQPKAAKKTKAEILAAKDRSIRAGFARKGIKGAVLMDRADRTKPFNVRPYGRILEDGSKTGWLAEGRVVKKGQTSVRGLFHVSQTEELPKAE